MKTAVTGDDTRRAHIRASGYAVLSRYGFQRTSMDDIAKEARMSRPALYLHYKNKDELLRDIVGGICRQSLDAAVEAAGGKRSKKDKLRAVLEASLFAPLEQVYESPHGVELLNVTHGSLKDILAAWQVETQSMLASIIGGRHGKDHARLLLDAIDGAKHRSHDPKEMRKAADTAIALILRD